MQHLQKKPYQEIHLHKTLGLQRRSEDLFRDLLLHNMMMTSVLQLGLAARL